jgi:pimeloyl-ACP methyl ester carboxylesterase
MIPTFFLGGILMPSRFRFGPLVAALGSPPELEVKELDVYASDRVPDDYSLASEIDALDRLAAERGYDRFHLYGYSIGGSIALAYVAAYPDKVVSLAVDEPATDFSDADRELLTAQGVNGLAEMPPEQRMHVYVRSLVRPVVEVGPSPAIPATPEMALRPAGLAAVSREVERYHVDEERLRAFDRPVYMSYGGLSSERWETMGARLAVLFPDCTVERYEGCHHLNTSHQAEPERVAGALKQLWSRSEG